MPKLDCDACSGTIGITVAVVTSAVLTSSSGPLPFFSTDALSSGQDARTWQLESCQCLPWSSVYKQHNVTCGEGYELASFGVGPPGVLPRRWQDVPVETYKEFCKDFFERFSRNSCVKFGIGRREEQWCYVSSGCLEETGTTRLAAEASVKARLCGAERGDELLRMKSPEELSHLALQEGLETGLLGKLAYPVWDGGRWRGVSDMWAGPEAFAGTESPVLLDPGKRAQLEAIKASARPMIFDSDDGHGGGTVVVGSRVYGFQPRAGGSGYAYQCVKDCGSGWEP